MAPDIIRAKSLLKSAQETIEAVKKIPIEQTTLKTILRELYEGLRQYCEALGYSRGYQFQSHEVITIFLQEHLNEPTIAARFDRYRKLRNGINYYGDEIAPQTVNDAIEEIPKLLNLLKKHLK